jgi:hypothetical protein
VTRSILAWYTGVCAALVLLVQGLSVFHLIMPLPFLVCAAAVALATAAVMKMRPRALRVRTDDVPRISHPLVLPFALVLPPVLRPSAVQEPE